MRLPLAATLLMAAFVSCGKKPPLVVMAPKPEPPIRAAESVRAIPPHAALEEARPAPHERIVYVDRTVERTVYKRAQPASQAASMQDKFLDTVRVSKTSVNAFVGQSFTIEVDVGERLEAKGESQQAAIRRSEVYSVLIEGNPAKDFEIHPQAQTRETQRRAPAGQPTRWAFQITPLRAGLQQSLIVVIRSYGPQDTIGTEVKNFSVCVNVYANWKSRLRFAQSVLSHPLLTNSASGIVGVLFTYFFMRKKRESRAVQRKIPHRH